MKKILLYGFKPFKKYKKNISEEVVKKIHKRYSRKVILPVIPKKEIILNQIKKYRPKIIIGIGQSGKGRMIRIERKAKNIYKKGGVEIKKKINLKGSKQYLVNLKLNKLPRTRISYNAGEYLCNFTMYVIMDFIKKENSKIKFAFLHIPKDYNIKKAVKTVEELIWGG